MKIENSLGVNNIWQLRGPIKLKNINTSSQMAKTKEIGGASAIEGVSKTHGLELNTRDNKSVNVISKSSVESGKGTKINIQA